MKLITKKLMKFVDSEFSNTYYILSKSSNKFIETMYNKIIKISQQWNRETCITSESDITNLPIMSNYIIKQARDYIKQHPFVGRSYEFAINNNNVKVNLIYPYDISTNISTISRDKTMKYFEQCIYKIYLWLSLAYQYKSPECSKKITINIYFTGLFKLLPERSSMLIDTKNANSAFTTSCKPSTEINIFREEEWFKVLIHESFHCLGFDFSHMNDLNTIANERLHEFLPFNINYMLYETYCEVNAEVLNIVFCVFLESPKHTYRENYKKIVKYLTYEQSFSCFQSSKVLIYNGLSYDNLLNPMNKSPDYRENTSVFAYYILKSIILNHINHYCEWFERNNKNTFIFQASRENMYDFIELIRKNMANKAYINACKTMELWLNAHQDENNIATQSLRMTMIEH